MLFTHVVRRKDLIDLFDTTPDLAGADVDVSRYIRENDDHDAQVFWREIDNDHSPDNQPAPSRDELCSAPIGDLRGKNAPKGLRWNFLDRKWETIRNESITPGMLIMLPVNEGGYSDILGWTGDKDDKPKLIPASKTSEEQTPDANDDDKDAQKTGAWQTIAEHTCKVVESLKNLIQAFPCLDEKSLEALRIAAAGMTLEKPTRYFKRRQIMQVRVAMSIVENHPECLLTNAPALDTSWLRPWLCCNKDCPTSPQILGSRASRQSSAFHPLAS
jgi:CRISPR-associated endonuclease/helicase Cas3